MRATKATAAHRHRASILLVMACGFATRGAWATCRVITKKASLRDVVVATPGLTFALDLKNVPVTIDLEEPGSQTAILQVLAPLRFVASYQANHLTYRIKRGVALAGGHDHIWVHAKDILGPVPRIGE